VRDLRNWPKVRQSVDTVTGEVRSTGLLNVKHGPSLTLHDGGLLVERSLPKAYRGENIHDLTAAEVGASVAVVEREVARALGVVLPPLMEWEPVRVDYCESRRLASEDAVLRSLDKLAGTVLPYKGLPVRGQNHSVRWPKGAIQPKFYSKYQETKGEDAALGVLRAEASVYRLDTFRKLTGLNSPVLSDALRAEIHGKVWEPYEAPLRGGAMTQDEIGDVEFARELAGFFGVRRAAALIGYCVLFVVSGAKTRQDMLNSPVLEFRTKYRVLADLKSFREHLVGRGYQMGEDESDVAVRIDRLRQAA
jgi:hypothetical protein